MRHVDPRACALGALAIHLFQRYHIDHEAVPEFDEQRYWHECLTPTNFKRKTTPLSYNSWNGAMKKAYAELNLSYKKTTHVFRSSGSKMAALGGCRPDEIRQHGRWNQEVMGSVYISGVSVFQVVLVLAGFQRDEFSPFWVRNGIIPPDDLQKQVFPFAEMSPAVHQNKTRGLIRLLQYLRVVFLQDSVIFRLSNPDLTVFKHPLFRSPQYLQLSSS